MKKTDKSKKSLAILVLSIITLAFFAACTNPLLPGPKKKPNPNRETGEVLSVSIAAAFDADGKGVTLTAEVTGDDGGELSYQWYSNAVDSNEEGTALADETTENFRPPTDTAGTSFYYIEVTNLLKGKTYDAVSGTVRIIVHPNGSVEVMVSEIETPTVTISTANDGGKVTLNAAAYVSDGGTLTYQWYKNAVNSSEGGTAIAGETKPAYTPPTSPNGTSYYYVRATSTLSRQTASAVSHTVRITVQGGSITEVLVSDSIETPTVNVTAAQIGGSVTLAATASVNDGGTLSYRWYKNTLDSSRGGTFITGATGTTFTPPVSGIDGASYYYVKVTNSLRGQTAEAVSNTVRIIIQGGSITEFVVSETIETPVVNVTAASDGVSVTLTATASVTDAGTITYQWYKNAVDNSKNGAIIAGATRSIYIPTVSNDGTTYYYVKVTNNLKGQTADAVSNTVKIIVQSGGITEWIVSDSVKTPSVNIAASVIGSSVTITATASVTDNGTLSYQWYRNIEENSRSGSPIAGAVGITYMPSTASPGTTYYYVKVTNTLKGQTSTATSNVLGVTVHESGGSVDIIEVVDTPTVSIESSVNGRTVTITATASVNDGGRLSYQWYSNEHNNRNGEEITGATERIYAPPTDAFGTTYYYVRVTNTLNGKTAVATSNIVGVAVPEGGGNIEVIEIETPDIDTPKVSIEANVNGRNVTITATASVTDGGELSYQWYSNSKNNKEGTRIAGATETSYIPTTEAVSTVYYYVEVTNSLNGNVASATSNIVGVVVPEDGGSVVIVEAEIPVATVIASPAPGPYAVGAVVVLTASASTPSDGGIISYQWYSNAANNKNGTIINGAIGSSYTAVTTSLATTYYYVMATNTLKGQTASATSNIVEITVVPTQITQATVGVIHPVKSAEPNAQVTTTPLNYTNGPVIWSSGGTVVTGFFEGNTAYTATVTLTANAGYTFAANFTATINTFSAIVTDKSETSVTISHAFGKTLGKDVKSVAVTTQPTKMSYTHGDELDLAGLEIKITYDDDSYDQGDFLELVAELGQDNVSASPAHGQKLMVSHGGGTVTISAGGKNTPTQTLAVAKKGLIITGVEHIKVYDGTTTVNQNPLSVKTWTGIEFNEAVTGINGIQAVYTSADAGTDTVNITDGVGTIVGQASSNYYVAGVNNVMVTDGIIQADPVVTWPTGLTASYGTGANTLAGVSLTGNNGSATGINSTSITGTFTWNTPARNIGDAGPRSHRMIFTPDSMNYNTITDTVSITVIEKPVTLTVGAVSRTLSAIDDATFSVTVDGLVSGHTVTFSLASNSYGLSVSSGTITTGESVTMTYNGTTTVTQTTALSVGLTMTDSNNYYTLSGSPTVAPTVADGRDAARPIPVTQENITRFNEYANTSNGLTRHYKVTENITIDTVVGGGNWTPIGSFTGSFDGQGYTITNLYVYIFDSTTRRVLGMFSYVNSGAIIKNIGLIKLYISGCYNDSSGGVVGYNAGTVENCYVAGINANNSFVSSTNINTSSDYTFYVGGVVGTNNGTVKNCYAIANVTATDNNSSNVKVGGVVGVNSGTVQNCAFFNNNDANKAVRSNGSNSLIGGVVGYMTGGTVQNCFASSNILNESNTSTNSNVGGVVGYMTGGTVQNCYAAGSVRGGEGLAGGVVGNIGTGTTTVTKCVALNSSITTRNSASTSIGRVWGGTTAPTTSSYNHGRNITGNPTPVMTMTYNNGTAYTLTSNLTGRDGANTTTYRTQTFWTGSAAANWGGTAWDIGTATTNTWQWYGTDGTTGRPILRNMPSGFDTNNYN